MILTERYREADMCFCEYGANKKNIKMINDIVRPPAQSDWVMELWHRNRREVLKFDKEEC